MQPNYQKTMYVCFAAYIVQAVVNCFVPLLFVTFQSEFGIPLTQITVLISLNFVVQLAVDLLSAGLIDRIGYRAAAVLAHGCAAAGLVCLTVLPGLLPDPFWGLLASVCVYAMGGGLIEVLISPIMEACPTPNKQAAMSLLHSFYCWGQMGVVALSTAFFALFGTGSWRLLALMWAVLPVVNGLLFARVPLCTLQAQDAHGPTLGQLLRRRVFWVFLLMMLCAGASEQAVSQWASTFAEQALGVSKTVGDLAGPMAFALLMGTARLIYGKLGDKLDLDRFMGFSCLLCIGAYLCIALVPAPVVGLAGCAVCGFSVGILWPGTYSKASAELRGGTAMFAMLALAGDLGCSAGPTLAGLVSSGFANDLRAGILAAVLFPAALLAGLVALARRRVARQAG